METTKIREGAEAQEFARDKEGRFQGAEESGP